MYIYNVTINIEDDVKNEWLTWLDGHILEVLNTGKFLSAKLTEVLVEEEMGGTTFSVQYTAKNKEDIERYYQEDAQRLRNNGMKLFGNKMVAFRTELRLIKEYYPTKANN